MVMWGAAANPGSLQERVELHAGHQLLVFHMVNVHTHVYALIHTNDQFRVNLNPNLQSDWVC